MKKKLGITKKVESLGYTILIMILGLVVFKCLPMLIWGKYILWDASTHIVLLSLILYVIYLIFEHNKYMRFIYVLFAIVALVFVGVQRYASMQHNLIGIVLGLLIAFFAIYIPRRRYKE